MCQRIAYLLLGSLFTFIVATVAAFAYLEWWQAILASAATFVLLIMIIQFYFKYLFQQGVGKMKNLAKGMLEGKSRVLRGATADVHTVKPASVPTSVRNWATPILEGHVDEEDEDTGTAESAARIDQVLRTPGDWLTYIYDFCDGWVHRVEIDGVRPGDRGRRAGAVPAGGGGRHTNMERNRRGPPRRSRPARNCSTCCSRPTARAANPRATSSGRPS